MLDMMIPFNPVYLGLNRSAAFLSVIISRLKDQSNAPPSAAVSQNSESHSTPDQFLGWPRWQWALSL